MLSYRHSFHAGNFADVLKHMVLLHSLNYLTRKDKPLRLVDTHAGAGAYRLSDSSAQKNREFDNGIGKLWTRSDLPPAVADYVNLVKGFNPDRQLHIYPGSPLIMQGQMRTQDHLFLHELHSTDWRLLTEVIGRDKRVKIVDQDGLQGLQGLLPPPDRRGLVLIDPSYEIKKDYQQVVAALTNACTRFSTGTYLLWYPVVQRQRIDDLQRALVRTGIRNIQCYELGITADNPEYGMTASGMVVINPPWTLWAAMEEALPYLADVLGIEGEGFYRLEQWVAE